MIILEIPAGEENVEEVVKGLGKEGASGQASDPLVWVRNGTACGWDCSSLRHTGRHFCPLPIHQTENRSVYIYVLEAGGRTSFVVKYTSNLCGWDLRSAPAVFQRK